MEKFTELAVLPIYTVYGRTLANLYFSIIMKKDYYNISEVQKEESGVIFSHADSDYIFIMYEDWEEDEVLRAVVNDKTNALSKDYSILLKQYLDAMRD